MIQPIRCLVYAGLFAAGAAAQIPAGYEVIEAFGGQIEVSWPRINDCGEIVTFTRENLDNATQEVVYYENGNFVQLTDNNIPDGFPDINDSGQIMWVRTPIDGPRQYILYQNGDETVFQEGADLGGTIFMNDSAHATWRSKLSQVCNEFGRIGETQLFHFDGSSVQLILDDGFSNQSPEINNSDQIVWGHAAIPCDSGAWSGDILLFSNGQITEIPTTLVQVQAPAINDSGHVVWPGDNVDGQDTIEFWNGIETVFVVSGSVPAINDAGDVAYNVMTVFTPWELWLKRDGAFMRLSDEADIEAIIDNIVAALNEYGEVAWKRQPNGLFTPSWIKYMRRIRNGDIDNDGLVALSDFAGMPDCMTGVGDFARLCACRFYDIEHDRDVDVADALKMQNAFDKPVPSATECCTAHPSPGCDNALVESCVCAMAPGCCAQAWDVGCVGLADAFCTSCFGLWDIELSVLSHGAAGISVGPGGAFSYEIVGALSNASSQGLAGFAFDLGLQGGPLDAPASAPTAVSSFVFPAGLSNPNGFGGLIDDGVLRQIGGLQNTFGGNCCPVGGELPSGDVVTGIGNEPIVLATGTATAPEQLGTFALIPQNILANVLISGPGAENQWQTQAAGAGPAAALIITVEPQVPIPAVSTWGIVVLGLLVLTTGTVVLRAGTSRLKIGRSTAGF